MLPLTIYTTYWLGTSKKKPLSRASCGISFVDGSFPRGQNDGPIDFHMRGLAKTPRKDQLDGFNLSSVKIAYKSMAKQYESHHGWNVQTITWTHHKIGGTWFLNPIKHCNKSTSINIKQKKHGKTWKNSPKNHQTWCVYQPKKPSDQVPRDTEAPEASDSERPFLANLWIKAWKPWMDGWMDGDGHSTKYFKKNIANLDEL